MMNIEQEIQNILDRNFTRGDNLASHSGDFETRIDNEGNSTIASPEPAKGMVFNFTPTYNISRNGKSIGSSTFDLTSYFNETF